jgi:hypothetical protein
MSNLSFGFSSASADTFLFAVINATLAAATIEAGTTHHVVENDLPFDLRTLDRALDMMMLDDVVFTFLAWWRGK